MRRGARPLRRSVAAPPSHAATCHPLPASPVIAMRPLGLSASPYDDARTSAPIGSPSSRTGRVKWFNDERGFGFLRSDQGEDAFVHHLAITGQSGRRTLVEGQCVRFDLVDGPKGLKAVNVQVID